MQDPNTFRVITERLLDNSLIAVNCGLDLIFFPVENGFALSWDNILLPGIYATPDDGYYVIQLLLTRTDFSQVELKEIWESHLNLSQTGLTYEYVIERLDQC